MDDWSCPHHGRWILGPDGWMQVVAPMALLKDGTTAPVCDCRPPPGPGLLQYHPIWGTDP